MKTIPPCLALVLALAWLGTGGTVRAQNSLYTANATTATVEPGVVHFLQMITLAQGPGTYTINGLTFSANYTTTDTQRVTFYFYTGVDTSPTSSDALAHATLLATVIAPDTPPAPGNYAFPYTIPSFQITTDGTGSIGVEIVLATPDPTDPTSPGSYSQTANGRFTGSAPTLGSSPGYVWNDANLDGVFTGAEQTRFGMANANTRLALIGSPPPTLKTFARSGTTATVTIDSYSGLNYQLQRATSLTAGDWTNVGDAVAGSTGTVLTFTDNDSTDARAFYRVTASLPPATARPAARKSALKR